jgi:hypothetical protein
MMREQAACLALAGVATVLSPRGIAADAQRDQ